MWQCQLYLCWIHVSPIGSTSRATVVHLVLVGRALFFYYVATDPSPIWPPTHVAHVMDARHNCQHHHRCRCYHHHQHRQCRHQCQHHLDTVATGCHVMKRILAVIYWGRGGDEMRLVNLLNLQIKMEQINRGDD